MKKQILSAFLSLCLLLCALPVRALEAEEGREDEYALYEARYQTEENGQWSYGSLSDACANVYADGRVELLRDIRQPAPVTITKKMTLASADPETPCKITYTTETRSDYLLTVSSTVTLADIILDGGREEGLTTHAELVGVQGGALTMNAGAVIQNNDNIDTAKVQAGCGS